MCFFILSAGFFVPLGASCKSDTGFLFVHTFCMKKVNVPLSSESVLNLDKCYETSQIFMSTERTFVSVRSFRVISVKLCFGGEMGLLALRGRPQSLKNPSQNL